MGNTSEPRMLPWCKWQSYVLEGDFSVHRQCLKAVIGEGWCELHAATIEEGMGEVRSVVESLRQTRVRNPNE